MRRGAQRNLVLRLSLTVQKQNEGTARHYRALLTYWLNTFFENQRCRPERFRRYSERPNISSTLGGLRTANGDSNGYGALHWTRKQGLHMAVVSGTTGSPTDLVLNASDVSNVYNSDVSTVQPAGLYGLCLIRFN